MDGNTDNVYVQDIQKLTYTSSLDAAVAVTVVENGASLGPLAVKDCTTQEKGVCRSKFIANAGLFIDMADGAAKNFLVIAGEALIAFGTDATGTRRHLVSFSSKTNKDNKERSLQNGGLAEFEFTTPSLQAAPEDDSSAGAGFVVTTSMVMMLAVFWV